jgi:hypothetical protein
MLKIHGKHEDKQFFPFTAGETPQVTPGVNATHARMEVETDEGYQGSPGDRCTATGT